MQYLRVSSHINVDRCASWDTNSIQCFMNIKHSDYNKSWQIKISAVHVLKNGTLYDSVRVCNIPVTIVKET